ncbi:MAG: histidine kinase dimerization/phospho-acceptor domain-containing protein, partial [Gemmatimonadaceae bacterium]
MARIQSAEERAASEVLRLKLRIRELGAALRNGQEGFNDMLESLQARESEAVQLAGERAGRAAAEAAAGRLRFLAGASALLSGSLDFEVTLASVARLAVPVLADLSAVDLIDRNGALTRLESYHPDPEKVRVLQQLNQRFPSPPDATRGPASVLRSGRPEAVFDVPDTVLREVARDDEHLGLLRALDISSYVIVPLIAGDEALGTLTLAYAESGRRYTADDVTLVEDVGRRAATAILNARLVRGLEDARQRLQNQAEELEVQTEELQWSTEELEIKATELESANADLASAMERAEGARAAAEAANDAKSQFLATMSHELRTPLNAIAGHGELLAMGIHGPLQPPQLEAIDRIRRSQRRLLSLVNDVLNFARLESGRVEMEMREVSVAEVFETLEAIVQPQMQLKDLTYGLEPCGTGLRVHADQEKMEQILLNLLSNA